MNIGDVIADLNRGRNPALLRLKWAKMRSSPFAFFRGTAPLFYQSWARERSPAAPLVWICGDAHLENIGSYRGDDGISYFDLNDFDEAVCAPAHFELGRALAGLFLLGKEQRVPIFLSAYLAALSGGKPRHIEPDVATGPIAKLLAAVQARTIRQFLSARTANGKLKLREGHSYALDAGVKARALRMFDGWAKSQPKPSGYAVRDICGRIAGNGSLGWERYMILVKGNQHSHIVDMKQAAPSAAKQVVSVKQPRWKCEAERVASVQYFMQYVPPPHLGWINAGATSYVLRQLQPREDRIDSTKLSQKDFGCLIQQWAKLIASAHLRSAGWRGSASLDELMNFGQTFKPAAQRTLLAAARRCAQRASADYRAFSRSALH